MCNSSALCWLLTHFEPESGRNHQLGGLEVNILMKPAVSPVLNVGKRGSAVAFRPRHAHGVLSVARAEARRLQDEGDTAATEVQRAVISLSSHAADDGPIVPRRKHLLSLMGGMAALSTCMGPAPSHAKKGAPSGEWSSPGLNAPEDPSLPKFFKTASGVKVQELGPGSGEQTAQVGDTVLFDYVLRRANGYFIYSTIEGVSFQPKDTPVGPIAFKLGEFELIPGLEEVLVGMKKGGKRRALIPPSAGYSDCSSQQPQPPTFATKRQLQSHCSEPLLFEIEVLRISK